MAGETKAAGLLEEPKQTGATLAAKRGQAWPGLGSASKRRLGLAGLAHSSAVRRAAAASSIEKSSRSCAYPAPCSQLELAASLSRRAPRLQTRPSCLSEPHSALQPLASQLWLTTTCKRTESSCARAPAPQHLGRCRPP